MLMFNCSKNEDGNVTYLEIHFYKTGLANSMGNLGSNYVLVFSVIKITLQAA